jgi:hypothetical protein
MRSVCREKSIRITHVYLNTIKEGRTGPKDAWRTILEMNTCPWKTTIYSSLCTKGSDRGQNGWNCFTQNPKAAVSLITSARIAGKYADQRDHAQICPHLKLAHACYYENKRERNLSFVAGNVIQSMKEWPKVCMQGGSFWKVNICLPTRKKKLDLQIDPKKLIVHEESCLPWPKQCWTPFVVTDHAKEWVKANYERIAMEVNAHTPAPQKQLL